MVRFTASMVSIGIDFFEDAVLEKREGLDEKLPTCSDNPPILLVAMPEGVLADSAPPQFAQNFAPGFTLCEQTGQLAIRPLPRFCLDWLLFRLMASKIGFQELLRLFLT